MSDHELRPALETVDITEGPVQPLRKFLAENSYSSIAVLTDDNTQRHCYPSISEMDFPHLKINIPPGEAHKNLQICTYIWEQMTNAQMDRNALIINLGGGVIGDMGGFCAATYKRGIPFINLPTTLLAQVDASVGGKLGIDFNGYKNHIGAFKEPERVIIATDFLKTLPEAEMLSGFAEVLKHTLIADSAYWDEIRSFSWEQQPWIQHVRHSVAVKHKVVTEDPRELGLRKILNFGHTVGHAIERHFLNNSKPLLHGEAVAAGMICETFLSQQLCGLPHQESLEISRSLMSWYGKKNLLNNDLKEIADNALHDKKNIDHKIQCTLLSRIGRAEYNVEVRPEEILGSLRYYTELSPIP